MLAALSDTRAGAKTRHRSDDGRRNGRRKERIIGIGPNRRTWKSSRASESPRDFPEIGDRESRPDADSTRSPIIPRSRVQISGELVGHSR